MNIQEHIQLDKMQKYKKNKSFKNHSFSKNLKLEILLERLLFLINHWSKINEIDQNYGQEIKSCYENLRKLLKSVYELKDKNKIICNEILINNSKLKSLSESILINERENENLLTLNKKFEVEEFKIGKSINELNVKINGLNEHIEKEKEKVVSKLGKHEENLAKLLSIYEEIKSNHIKENKVISGNIDKKNKEKIQICQMININKSKYQTLKSKKETTTDISKK